MIRASVHHDRGKWVVWAILIDPFPHLVGEPRRFPSWRTAMRAAVKTVRILG
ncbi:hypothetical protein [Jiangella asiatica]|uniref:hypothetical protein n=1 Tax=Jiangella asiatica TaxID=2530372 RepID=UPI0013A5E4A7|nr:hypothetical protein [Jiangella asiatica]